MHSVPPDRYALVVLGIDPGRAPGGCTRYGRQRMLPASAWRFPRQARIIVSAAPTKCALSKSAIGFPARYDPQLRQYLHPTGLVVLTPPARSRLICWEPISAPGDLGSRADTRTPGKHRKGCAARSPDVLSLSMHPPAHYSLAIVKPVALACALTALTVGGMIAPPYCAKDGPDATSVCLKRQPAPRMWTG